LLSSTSAFQSSSVPGGRWQISQQHKALDVARLDLAIAFYKTWLPEGQRWTFSKMKWGDPDWWKENLVLNFALGYPF